MKNRSTIRKIPMLLMLIAFAIGVLSEQYLPISFQSILIIFIVSIALYLIAQFLPVHLKYSLRYVRGCLLLLSFTMLGSLLLWKNNIAHDKNFAGNHQQINAYLVRLNESLTIKPKSYKSVGSIEKILINKHWIKAKGDLFIYFKKDSLNTNLSEGSQIVFTKSVQQIVNAGNPGEFDYANYCHSKGIYFEQFLNRNDYALLNEKKINFFAEIINKTKDWITKSLHQNIENTKAQSLAKALLIGQHSDLDKDIIQSYSDAGIIRLLSTSGLHLIIVVEIFVWLLRLFVKRKRNVFQVIFVILFIWLFTFIEGVAPSVLRAAIVLTIYHFSEIVGRKHNAYSALVLSAFIILIINPYNLFDAGFLLTYAALLSIRLFYKMIFGLLKIRNKMLKSIWMIVSLSLSAQILTLPFILYYFHRFPILFLVSNIVAMPLSAIIIYVEIILLIATPIRFIAKFIGKILQALILFLDKIIESFSHLRFAVIQSSYINILQLIMLLIAFISIYFFIKARWKNGFTIFISCVASCIFIGFAKYKREEHQQKIIVYNIQKYIVIDFINGHSLESLSDTLFDKNSEEFMYVIKPARDFYNINSTNNLSALKQNYPFIQFKNKSVFVLNNNVQNKRNNARNADVVIVSRNNYIDFDQLKNVFPKSVFVFTNENSLWKIERWKKTCDSLHLHSHSISHEGAFEMNL